MPYGRTMNAEELRLPAWWDYFVIDLQKKIPQVQGILCVCKRKIGAHSDTPDSETHLLVSCVNKFGGSRKETFCEPLRSSFSRQRPCVFALI